MNKLINTIGFGMIQTTAGILIALWTTFAHERFRCEHPEGQGTILANLYWDYSWWYLAMVGLLLIIMGIAARRKWDVIYSLTIYLGYTLLIVWFGFAKIGMDCAIPEVCLHGVHW